SVAAGGEVRGLAVLLALLLAQAGDLGSALSRGQGLDPFLHRRRLAADPLLLTQVADDLQALAPVAGGLDAAVILLGQTHQPGVIALQHAPQPRLRRRVLLMTVVVGLAQQGSPLRRPPPE